MTERIRAPIQATLLRYEAQRTGGSPRLDAITDHLLATGTPGWNPLADAGLHDRIQAILR